MSAKFVPALTQPCPLASTAMNRGEKTWFCSHCQLHVHNLTALPPAEQRALFAKRQERICVAYEKRADSVSVQPGAWLWLQRILVPWRIAVAVLTMVISLSAPANAANQAEKRSTHSACTGSSCHYDGKKATGGVVNYDRPWWKKVFLFWEK